MPDDSHEPVVPLTGEVLAGEEDVARALTHARQMEAEWRETRRDLSTRLVMIEREQQRDRLDRLERIEAAAAVVVGESTHDMPPSLGAVERLRAALTYGAGDDEHAPNPAPAPVGESQ